MQNLITFPNMYNIIGVFIIRKTIFTYKCVLVQKFRHLLLGYGQIKWTQKREGQTDTQTDTKTGNEAKNKMSPHCMGGDIMHSW